MGTRRSDIQQVFDNTVLGRKAPRRSQGHMNSHFSGGHKQAQNAEGDMTPAVINVPLNTRGRRNKATK